MFSFVIVLALASFILEMMVAAKIPAWRKNAKKYKMVNLVLSILLSFVMGVLFGAAGLIVMTAAILSTLMSIPGYSFLHWCYDSPQAIKNGGNQVAHIKKQTINSFHKMKVALIDLFNLIYKIIRFITFPIWGTRAALNKIRSYRS